MGACCVTCVWRVGSRRGVWVRRRWARPRCATRMRRASRKTSWASAWRWIARTMWYRQLRRSGTSARCRRRTDPRPGSMRLVASRCPGSGGFPSSAQGGHPVARLHYVITVRGEGNLEALTAPPASRLRGVHVYGVRDHGTSLEGASRLRRWTYDVEVTDPEMVELPPVRFAFLDLSSPVQFRTVQTAPLPLPRDVRARLKPPQEGAQEASTRQRAWATWAWVLAALGAVLALLGLWAVSPQVECSRDVGARPRGRRSPSGETGARSRGARSVRGDPRHGSPCALPGPQCLPRA